MSMELKVIGFREDFAVFKKSLADSHGNLIANTKKKGLRFASHTNPFKLEVDYDHDTGWYISFIKYKNLFIGSGEFSSMEALFETLSAKDLLKDLDIEKVIELTSNVTGDSEEDEGDYIEPEDISGLGSAIAHRSLTGMELSVTPKQSYQFQYEEEKVSLRVSKDTLPGYVIAILSSESGRVLYMAREIEDTPIKAILKFFTLADYEEIAKECSKDFLRLEAIEIAAHWVLEDDKFLDDMKARIQEIYNEKRN